jgi:ParB family chromosome partitioning protein
MAKKGRTVDIGFLQSPAARTDLSTMFAGSLAETQTVTPIAPERLLDNPYQPRRMLDPAGIAELAGVMATQGFQGALAARPHPSQPGYYQLAWGHRRREAARQAGLATVPVIVRDLADEELVILAITENIQRTDLSPLEEGDTYRLMIDELGYTQEQIATEIGKDRGYVVNRLRVARAPEDIRALVAAKPDTLRAVAYLIKVKDPARRTELIAQLRAGMLTGDNLPEFVSSPPDTTPPPAARAGERTGGGEPTADVQARAGNGKLRAALRTLTVYRSSLEGRDEISAREFVTLTDLKRLVDELYERCGPQEPQR